MTTQTESSSLNMDGVRNLANALRERLSSIAMEDARQSANRHIGTRLIGDTIEPGHRMTMEKLAKAARDASLPEECVSAGLVHLERLGFVERFGDLWMRTSRRKLAGSSLRWDLDLGWQADYHRLLTPRSTRVAVPMSVWESAAAIAGGIGEVAIGPPSFYRSWGSGRLPLGAFAVSEVTGPREGESPEDVLASHSMLYYAFEGGTVRELLPIARLAFHCLRNEYRGLVNSGLAGLAGYWALHIDEPLWMIVARILSRCQPTLSSAKNIS